MSSRTATAGAATFVLRLAASGCSTVCCRGSGSQLALRAPSAQFMSGEVNDGRDGGGMMCVCVCVGGGGGVAHVQQRQRRGMRRRTSRGLCPWQEGWCCLCSGTQTLPYAGRYARPFAPSAPSGPLPAAMAAQQQQRLSPGHRCGRMPGTILMSPLSQSCAYLLYLQSQGRNPVYHRTGDM